MDIIRSICLQTLKIKIMYKSSTFDVLEVIGVPFGCTFEAIRKTAFKKFELIEAVKQTISLPII